MSILSIPYVRLYWVWLSLLLCCAGSLNLLGQTPLLTDFGTTHENTDVVITDDYGSVDISTCTSISFQFDFEFSFPWEGDGNMESVDECGNFGDCPGDPDDPIAGACFDCWDFLEVSFLVDGAEVFNELIGGAGTTNADQVGSFTLDGYCTDGAASAAIQARTQNWGSGESVTYSNITILCYEGVPTASANPDPICASQTLNLEGSVDDAGIISDVSWSGPGDIDDPTSINTTATNLIGPTATFTLSTTDINGCIASTDVTVDVAELVISEPAPVELCYSLSPVGVEDFNLTTIENELTGGDPSLTVNWYFDPTGTDNLDWFNPADLNRIATNLLTTVYAGVSDGNCESNIVPVAIILSEFYQPDNQQVEICPDENGLATYFPSDSDNDFNDGNPALTVSYHNSQADAESGASPITGIVTTPVDLTLFVRVASSADCAGFAELELIVTSPGSANDAFLTACDNGFGEGEFDLALADADVLGLSFGTVTYYLDPSLTDEIFDPFQFVSRATTIYAVIIDDDGCASAPSEVILELETIDDTQVGLTLTPATACGSTLVSVALETPFDPPGDYTYDIEYGPQAGGPFSNITLVGQTGDTPFSIQIDETHVFRIIAVTGPEPNDCRVDFFPPLEFVATISSGPVASPAAAEACDTGNGEATFNLTTLSTTVDGGTNQAVSYFFDEAATMPLTTPTAFMTSGTTVYGRVSDSEGCAGPTAAVTLTVVSGPVASPAAAEACDTGNGEATFNLTTLSTTVDGGTNQAVSYFFDEAATMPLTTPTAFMTSSTTVYGRVRDSEGCAGPTAAVTLTVTSGPVASPAAAEACDTGNGEATFNLTTLSTTVDGGTNQAVSYFFDEAATMPLTTPAAFMTTSATVYGRVSDSEGCTGPTAEIILTVNPLPTFNVASTPISCNGAMDGTLTVTDLTGTPNFTYNWTPASIANIPNPTNLGPGNYAVTVTDANNCSANDQVMLSEASALVLACTEQSQATNGGSDGVASITINGGTPTYSYALTGPVNRNSSGLGTGMFLINNLPPGNYRLDVTDSSNCTDFCEFTIAEAEPACDLMLNCELTREANEPSGMGGQGRVTISGGTPPYDYFQTGPAAETILDATFTSRDLTGLQEGTYTIRIVDEAGCELSCTLIVPRVSCDLVASAVATDISCNGADDGSIDLTIMGTHPVTTIDWNENTFDGTEDPTNITMAGTFTVTLTDAFGCTAMASATVAEPAVLSIDCSNTVDPTSVGGTNGTLAATLSGGTAPYDLSWTGPVNGNQMNVGAGIFNLTNLSAGTYTVAVTDANNCQTSCDFTLNDPGCDLTVSCAENAVGIGNGPGSYTYTISGGTPPYRMERTGPDPAVIPALPVPGDQQTDVLTAGDYTITITDANNCVTTCGFVVISCDLSLDCSDTFNPFIVDEANGGVRLQFAGGTAPYAYTYSGPISGDSTDVNIDNPVLTGLAAGDYNLNLTDATGCMASCAFTLINPVCDGITVESYTVSPACFGDTSGQIVLFIDSQRVIDSFAVDNPLFTGLTFYGLDATLSPIYGTSGLPAGDYTVEVFDEARCSETLVLTIEEPNPLEIDCSDRADPSGAGLADGFVRPLLTGGSLPYTVSWDGPQNGTELLFDPRGFTITDLPAGLYHIQVVDAMGCVQSCDFILEALPTCDLVASLIATPLSCAENQDGQLALSLTGGTAPFTYDWSDDTLDGQGDSGTVGNLSSGTYRLTITDSEGCQAVTSTFLPELPPLEINCLIQANPSAPGASDGIIIVRILSATPGPYTLTYTGDNGESGSLPIWPTLDLAPRATIDSLPAGNYTLTVRTGAGCTATCMTSLTVFPCVVDSIDVNVNGMMLVCPDDTNGMLEVNLSSATTGEAIDPADYNFTWNFPEFNGQTMLSDLSPGVYALTVTNVDGCEVDPLANRPAIVAPPDLVLVCSDTINPSSLATADGANDLFLAGGTPPYTLNWAGPTNGTETGLFAGEYRLDNLRAGAYTLTMTDASGCVTECSFILDVALDCDLMLACRANGDGEGQGPGSYTFTFSGGIPVYQLILTGPLDLTLTQNTNEPYNTPILPPGNWTFTVVDGEGCAQSCTFTIVDCSQLTAQLVSTGVSCDGATDGIIGLEVFFGTAPYTLDWSDDTLDGTLSDDTLTIRNLAVGTYDLTVTDGQACVSELSVDVGTFPNPVTNCRVVQSPTNAGASDGSINVEITMGAPGAYTITYDNGAGASGTVTGAFGNNTIGNLPVGTYSITASNAAGCMATCTLEVTPNACGFSLTPSAVAESCAGALDGQVTVLATGGATPYRYQWDTGAMTSTVIGVPPGSYVVSVTDNNGCTAQATATVNAGNPRPSLSVGPGATICADSCYRLPLSITSANFPVQLDYELLVNGVAEGRQQNFTAADSELLLCPEAESIAPGDFQVRFLMVTDLTTNCDSTILEVQNFRYLPPAVGVLTSTLCFGDSLVLENEVFNTTNPTGELILAGAATSGCDSIVMVDLSFYPENRVALNTTICATDTVNVGTEIFTNNRTSGEVVLTDSNGCDSTVVVQLTVLNPGVNNVRTAICAGDSLVIAGEVFNESRPAGIIELSNQAANGCDSLIIVTLLPPLPPAIETFEFDICPTDTLRIGGQAFFADNLTDTLRLANAAVNGCDSILQVNLSLRDVAVSQLSLQICAGDSVMVGDSLLRATGNYDIVLPAVTGDCDSLVQVELEVLPPAVGTLNPTLCAGDSLVVNAVVFNAANPSGNVPLPGAAASGCDSLVQVDLQFSPPLIGQIQSTLCAGDSLQVGEEWFDADRPSGSVLLSGAGSTGCDSLVQVDLQFSPPLIGQVQQTLCTGDSLQVGTEWFTADRPSGSVLLSGAGSTGCDSLVQVDLVFLPGSLNTVDTVLCADASLQVGDQFFTVDRPTGIVVLPGAAASGCDSTVFVTTRYQDVPTASLGSDQNICPGTDATVMLTFSSGGTFDFRLSASDGTEVEEVAWNGNEDYTLNLSGITANTSVRVASITHTSGCTVSVLDDESQITVSDLSIALSADNGPRVSCAGAKDGALRVDVRAGIAPFTYRWSTGATEAALEDLRAGTFVVSVSDGAGCTVVDSFTLLEPLPIVVLARALPVGCLGSSTGAILIDSIAGGSAPYEYSLDGEFFAQATSFPQVIPNQMSGDYTLYVQDAADCSTTVELVVFEGENLALELGADETIALGDSILLNPDFNFDPASWVWTPPAELSQPDSLITYATPTSSTLYRLEMTDVNGCRISDEIRIIVEERLPIYVPNAFSPNEDGSNEVFMIFGQGVEQVEAFQIFDRWGNQVFADGGFLPNDPAHGWDGTLNGEPMNAAVFVYWVQLRLSSGEVVQLEGEVLLLR